MLAYFTKLHSYFNAEAQHKHDKTRTFTYIVYRVILSIFLAFILSILFTIYARGKWDTKTFTMYFIPTLILLIMSNLRRREEEKEVK